MKQKDSQWMSIGQAARYLGISRDTLRRWEKRGKIKTIRSPSNRRYYTKEILDAAMGGKKETSQPREKTKLSLPKVTSKNKQLIIIGVVSFAATIVLALAIRLFLRN